MADEGTVLVVDDDPSVRNVVEMTLTLAGYSVMTAADGQQALDAVRDAQPDLIVLDVMMPGIDGFEVCRRLKADARVSHVPVLMLTAKARLDDKLEGLAGGADDYVTKPFDPEELVARVQAVLRRTRETGSLSPLTGLPANVRIEQELARRFAAGERVAVLYADANNFKSLNDRYGWLRGDEAIALIADIFREQVRRHGDESTFVGHIGGDDFVAITSPETAELIARDVAKSFDEQVVTLYEEDDLARGYIEVEDRQGNPQRYPPVTLSVGIASNVVRTISDHRQLVEIATEMKNFAKRVGGRESNYAMDRRVG